MVPGDDVDIRGMAHLRTQLNCLYGLLESLKLLVGGGILARMQPLLLQLVEWLEEGRFLKGRLDEWALVEVVLGVVNNVAQADHYPGAAFVKNSGVLERFQLSRAAASAVFICPRHP